MESRVITKVISAIRDHWSTWTEEYTVPPVFNVEAYQNRLNQITGLANGHPILKLEWGGEERISKTLSWDEFGNPKNVSFIPKHAIPRKNSNGGMVKIPIRRWIITQYQTPQQLRVGDERDNTFTDEHGVTCRIGDKPVGEYTPLIYIGDHTKCKPNCCTNRICLGDYKQPDAAELDWVLEKTYLLQTERIADPFKPEFTAKEKKAIAKEVLEKQETKRRKYDEEFDAESKDWFNAHSHRLTGDEPKYKHFYKENKPV